MYDFWCKWVNADWFTRRSEVAKLVAILERDWKLIGKNPKLKKKAEIKATLLNSYFEDLYMFMLKEGKK